MQTSNLTVLGVDPGIARLGYALVNSKNNELRLGTFGVVETTNKLSPADRLLYLHTQLKKLIARYQPTRIALEQLFFSKNTKTAMAVSEARGVVLLTAAEGNIPIVEFSPQVVKQSVTGFGNANKRQIQRLLQILFHLPNVPTPDDAADAIALAVCGTNRQFS